MNRRNSWGVGVAAVMAIGAMILNLYSAQPVLGGPVRLKISAKEFAFTPKILNASAGLVQFVVTNTGTVEHSFVSDELKIKSGPIKAGRTVTITANATPGTYKVYCDIPGHKELGMVAALSAK